MEAASLPDDTAVLKGIIADMATRHEAVIADHKAVIADRDAAITERDAVITDHEQLVGQLQEQVRLLKAWRFAATSEKARSRLGEDQYSLFDEAELAAMQAEVAPEADEDVDEETETTEVAGHTRRKRACSRTHTFELTCLALVV